MNLKNINIKQLGKRFVLMAGGVAIGATLVACGKNSDKEEQNSETIVSTLVNTDAELNENKEKEMYLNVNLNVRSEHFVGENKIVELTKGTSVTINTEVDTYNDGEYDWAYITYLDKLTNKPKSGWVVAVDYTGIEPVNYLTSNKVIEDKDNEKHASVNLNVRMDHSTGADKITSLSLGTKVYINEELESYNDGKYEWIYIDYVDEKTNEKKSGWVVAVDYTGIEPVNYLFGLDELKKNLQEILDKDINSESVILLDVENNKILYGKNIYKQMEPASITKTLSAYIILKYGNIEDKISYSNTAINVEGHAANGYGLEKTNSMITDIINTGRLISVKDALYISLLYSDNRTTVALQEYIESVTGRNFEDIMNEEAKNIGCMDSNFTNSYGYEDPNHLITANDMAKIMSHIVENSPETIEIMGAESYKLEFNGKIIRNQSSILLTNSEYYIKDAIASKTGWTTTAGQTMVSAYNKDGKKYVIVTLKGSGAPSKFQDAMKLFNSIDVLTYESQDNINDEVDSNEYETTKNINDVTLENDSVKTDEETKKVSRDNDHMLAPLSLKKIEYMESKTYTMEPLVSKPKINYTYFSGDKLVEVDTGHYYKGIDVSSHQERINWEEVSENIDFALIRVGKTAYRTNEYGEDVFNTVMVDEYFEYNISECNRLGIPVGVYYYSLATTEEENLQEIKCVLDSIEKYNITLPVYRDIEAASQKNLESGEEGRINQNNLTKQFCDIIGTAGYDTGVYINKNYRSLLTLDEECSFWLCGGYYYGTKSPNGMSYDDMPYMYEDDGIIYKESEYVDILQVSEYGSGKEVGISSTTYVDYNYANKEFINEMIKKNDKKGNVKVLR